MRSASKHHTCVLYRGRYTHWKTTSLGKLSPGLRAGILISNAIRIQRDEDEELIKSIEGIVDCWWLLLVARWRGWCGDADAAAAAALQGSRFHGSLRHFRGDGLITISIEYWCDKMNSAIYFLSAEVYYFIQVIIGMLQFYRWLGWNGILYCI